MNTIDVLVGHRIRVGRHAAGMSQAQLGQAVGVKFQQIQKYETGANRVSASRLWAIADTLKVPVFHFFQGVEPSGSNMPCAAKGPFEKKSDPQEWELVEQFRFLKREHKRAILDMVRAMKQPERAEKAGVEQAGAANGR